MGNKKGVMQFDDKLAAKIREVFDNYEDQHADYGWQQLRKKYPKNQSLPLKIRKAFDNYEDPGADYGWQELRKKYPAQRNRRPFVLWLSSAAAVLILALGVWALSPKKQQAQNFTTNVKLQTEPKSTRPNQPGISIDQQKDIDSGDFASKNDPNRNLETEQIAKNQPSNQDKSTPINPYHSDNPDNKEDLKEDHSNKAAMTANKESGIKTQEVIINKTLIPSTLDQKERLAHLTVKQPNQLPDSVSKTPFETNHINTPAKKRTLLDLAMEEDSKKKKEEQTKSDKKVIFGVYAGSFISYAAGSANKVNLGAGFSSDIAITKNLKLSTGIAIARNELAFHKHIPLSAQTSFQNSIQRSPIVANSKQGFAQTLSVISYNLNNYEASLLGLDIPVNLKYSFSQRKSEYFLSAGFSSGTFLNESYTYSYSGSGLTLMQLPNTEPVLNEDKVDKTSGKFDFARMLNISFGVGYPLGKQNRLIIEPFIKYPLKEVGAENLRFGSSGVNLKLNFQTAKSKK